MPFDGSPTLIIDVTAAPAPALVVSEQGSWLVPAPATYPVGLGQLPARDPAPAFAGRWPGPVDPAIEIVTALRNAAQRRLASAGTDPALLDRATIITHAGVGVADPLRSRLVGATEAAGFTAVELLGAATAAVWAPGSPLRTGDLVLVYDLGSAFEASLVRAGEDGPEILGQASIVDWPPTGRESVESLTVATCRDLLARLGVDRTHVAWMLPVGGGVRQPGLVPLVEHALGIAAAMIDEPELAVLHGAAARLHRGGSRTVAARGLGPRLVPLAYTIPGGTARLLRWLVEPRQAYEEGAVVARVRLSGGAIWDLTTRSRGVLDEVLVPSGRQVRSGDWLALVRPT